MFICEACKKKPATVHLTNIENNNIKKQVHLCEACAQKGKLSFTFQLPQAVMGMGKEESDAGADAMPELKCEVCGVTWQEFRSCGRFGCANDVVVFRDRLKNMIGDIQAHEFRHIGKTPAGRTGSGEDTLRSSEYRRMLREYRRQLREAAQKEEYERAAEIRDRITELKQALAGKNANDHQ